MQVFAGAKWEDAFVCTFSEIRAGVGIPAFWEQGPTMTARPWKNYAGTVFQLEIWTWFPD